jgi:uncharacterized protein (UPF0264 family)
MLASVTSETEALLCAHLAVDLIDAKNPTAGALGALPYATVKAIRARVPRHIPVSTTVGDVTADAESTARAVVAVAQTGVDIVKVGIGRHAAPHATLERLSSFALGDVSLVGVLLADEGIAFDLIGAARDAGFAGLMLDTADKRLGPLPDVVPAAAMLDFVSATRQAGMFAGLAGSLRAEHVPYLLELSPDVLGFRGGLCRRQERTSAIDPEAVRNVRRAIPFCDTATPLLAADGRRRAGGAA